jgi:hypothetical protein
MAVRLDPMQATIRTAVLEWLASVHDGGARWKYSRDMLRPWAVESSAMAVRLLVDTLGAQLPPAHLAGLTAEIQGWQEPSSGLFKDPLLQPGDHVGSGATHTWEHIWNHHTGICLEALTVLGARPLHPLPPDAFGLGVRAEPAGVEAWVLGLDWENPWLAGEHFSRGIAVLLRTDCALAGTAFDVLQRDIMNPASGYPDRRSARGPMVAMAGLFKVLSGYRLAGRPVPYVGQAMDSTLALQDQEGGMGMDNLCIHWDAAWVLKNLNAQAGGCHRFADLRAAGRRLAAFLVRAHRKPDGGFSFHRAHCVTVHNSVRVSAALPQADIMGTLMSCECLRYADEWEQGISTPTLL